MSRFRETMEVAGGLMDGRPRKGRGAGGDSAADPAADSAAAGDLKRRSGRGSRGTSGHGERILTRLGAIRIRAPGDNPDDVSPLSDSSEEVTSVVFYTSTHVALHRQRVSRCIQSRKCR